MNTLQEEWEKDMRVTLHAFANVVTGRDGEVEPLNSSDFLTASSSVLSKIRTKLESQRTADLEALRERMPKEKICIHRKNWDGKTQLRPCECVFGEVGGFNDCRSQVLALLDELIEKPTI